MGGRVEGHRGDDRVRARRLGRARLGDHAVRGQVDRAREHRDRARRHTARDGERPQSHLVGVVREFTGRPADEEARHSRVEEEGAQPLQGGDVEFPLLGQRCAQRRDDSRDDPCDGRFASHVGTRTLSLAAPEQT
jgi:hypothetical protein